MLQMAKIRATDLPCKHVPWRGRFSFSQREAFWCHLYQGVTAVVYLPLQILAVEHSLPFCSRSQPACLHPMLITGHWARLGFEIEISSPTSHFISGHHVVEGGGDVFWGLRLLETTSNRKKYIYIFHFLIHFECLWFWSKLKCWSVRAGCSHCSPRGESAVHINDCTAVVLVTQVLRVSPPFCLCLVLVFLSFYPQRSLRPEISASSEHLACRGTATSSGGLSRG